MVTCTETVLSLCSGIGGLDLGYSAATGSRTVCYVEREAFAAATLVARMEDSTLEDAPIWDDLKTFDGKPWRGKVDTVIAGFPCQAVSIAGKRDGQDDERWLWDDVARIIREVGPRKVFLENVSGILSLGCGDVLRDLALLGFDAQWCVFRASEVGAPQDRKRWFCLAYSQRDGDQRRGRPEGMAGKEGEAQTLCGEWKRSRNASDHCSGTMELFAPGPEERRRWGRFLETYPSAQPSVRREADGTTTRLDRLKALGNGVVPLQAAAAYYILADRAGIA